MRKLPYFKPFLTFEEQAGLLEERGLLITTDEEREFLADFLRNLNFHRFEGPVSDITVLVQKHMFSGLEHR